MARHMNTGSTLIAALAVATLALSLSPVALAGHGRGDAPNDRRDERARPRQAEPASRPAERGGNRGERDGRHGERAQAQDDAACCVASGAGILRIGKCAVHIGDNHKYKKIANAFKDAGYQAYVRSERGVTSVRVYGYPAFEWTPGEFETHTTRAGSVLDIQLCRVRR